MKIRALILFILMAFGLSISAQSDSLIHIYAVQQDSAIEIRPIRHRTTHTVRKRLTFVNYTEFKNSTAAIHFDSIAHLRVVIPSTSRLQLDDFGICLFKSDGSKRYLVTLVTNQRGSRNCTDYSDEMDISTKKINATTTDLYITGPSGEYGLTPFISGTAGLGTIFDFALSNPSADAKAKYTIRNRKTKNIW